MKTLNFLTIVATMLALLSTSAHALGPTINSLNVQGYMKRSDNTAVSAGPFVIAFGVYQNNVAIWGTSASVTFTNGLFTQSLSGVGANLSALTCNGQIAGADMNKNWSGTGLNKTLDPALLIGSASGGLSVHICSTVTIDGSATPPEFDITLTSVPTSYVAALAENVQDNSIALVGLNTNDYSAVGGGANHDKLAQLDGGGQVAVAMVPNLNASIINAGQIGAGNGGTGSATTAATAGGVIAADGTKLVSTLAGTTGDFLTSAGAGTPTWSSPAATLAAISGAHDGNNTDLTGLNPTGGLNVGGAATTSVNVGGTATTSVNITPTGANATVNIASVGTGTLTVGGAGTGNATFGNFGGSSMTVLQSGTAGIGIAGATQLVLPSTGFAITQGAASTGDLTIATTSNKNILLAPNGTGTVQLSGPQLVLPSTGFGITEGAAATGDLSLITTNNKNIALAPNGTGTVTIASGPQLVLPATGFGIVQGAAATGNLTLGTTNSKDIAISGATQLILPATGFAIAQAASSTGALTISTTNNQNIVLAPNGSGTVVLPTGQTSIFTTQHRWAMDVNPAGAAVAAITNVGYPTAPTIVGTAGIAAVNADTATQPFMSINTNGAAADSAAGWGPINANSVVRIGWNPIYHTRISTTGTAGDWQNTRMYWGFSSFFANMNTSCGAGLCTTGAGGAATNIACRGNGGAGILKNGDAALFRFAHGTTSDAQTSIRCVICNTVAAACTEADSGFIPNTSPSATPIDLEIDLSSTQAIFKINGTTLCTMSGANMPSAATGLSPVGAMCTTAAVAKKIQLNHMDVSF